MSGKKKDSDTKEIKALRVSMDGNPLVRKIEDEGGLIVAEDELFGGAIVYALCGYDDIVRLHGSLFENPGKLGHAHGWCIFGKMKGVNNNVHLIHVNTDWIPKDKCLDVLLHEITHFADSTISHADVDDKNGEVRACLVEREVRRVLPKFFGMECYKEFTTEFIKELIK